MKHLKFLAPAILLLFTAGCAGVKLAAPVENIERVMFPVATVRTYDLDYSPARLPRVSNKNVAEVVMGAHEKEWNVIALRAGTVRVEFLREDGTPGKTLELEVVTGEQARTLAQARDLLSKIEGITVSLKGGVVIVDGALVNPDSVIQDYDRIMNVARLYMGQIYYLVGISEELYQASARKMTQEIQSDPGSGDISVRAVNGTFLIIGNAPSDVDRTRAEVIVQTFLPPMLGSPAVRDEELVLGAKKYSIRNLIHVGGTLDRSPASFK